MNFDDCFSYYSNTYDALVNLFLYIHETEQNYDFRKNSKEDNFYLLLLINITLLGLNKDNIDRNLKNYFYDVNSNEFSVDITKLPFNNRTMETNFNDFLNVKKNVYNRISNLDYIKMIRNAFLHGEFIPYTIDNLHYIEIKNKKSFEAVLLFENFESFVFKYFGNSFLNGNLDKMCVYEFDRKNKMNNMNQLGNLLVNLEINSYNVRSKNLDTSIEKQLYKYVINNGEIKQSEFDKMLNDDVIINQNTVYRLGKSTILIIGSHLMNYYTSYFYKLPLETKKEKLTEILEFIFNNASFLSSSLISLSSQIHDQIKRPKLLPKDKFFSLSIILSLMFAYLIIYRIENKFFEKINYDLINLGKIKVSYHNQDNSKPTSNYLEDYLTYLSKVENIYDKKTLEKAFFCRIFRNAIAHGNIEFLYEYSDPNFRSKNINLNVRLKNDLNGKIILIDMDIDEFNKFLASPAFLPHFIKELSSEKTKKL